MYTRARERARSRNPAQLSLPSFSQPLGPSVWRGFLHAAMYGGSVPFPDEAEVLPGLPVTGTSEPMLGDAASNAKKRFGDTEAYRDKPFAVLFLLQALGVVAIAIANGVSVVRGAAGHPAGDPERVKGERSHQMLIMLVVASFVAAVLAACWLLLLRSGARALIWLGAIGGVVLALANGLWLFLQGGAAGIFLGVFSLLAGLMCLAFLVTNRHRVEFSAHLLARVASLTRLYPGTVYVAIGCAGVMLLWTLIWTAAVSYTSQMRNQATVLVLLMLSYLWMAQLLRAVVHTTVAGTVASDYFLSPHVPRDPTSRSLRRSLTTSFGSLCLGALVAAALKTARAAASAASKNGPDRFGLRSAALCVLGFLDVLTRFCNELAYTQVPAALSTPPARAPFRAPAPPRADFVPISPRTKRAPPTHPRPSPAPSPTRFGRPGRPGRPGRRSPSMARRSRALQGTLGRCLFTTRGSMRSCSVSSYRRPSRSRRCSQASCARLSAACGRARPSGTTSPNGGNRSQRPSS